MILSAPIVGGKAEFHPNDQRKLSRFLSAHEGKVLYFVVDHRKPPRSLQQNAYLWIVYEYIAAETGNSAEDVHAEMKEKFLPRFFTRDNGVEQELEKSTARLNTKEMKDYIESVRAFAASELGISVPDPE